MKTFCEDFPIALKKFIRRNICTHHWDIYPRMSSRPCSCKLTARRNPGNHSALYCPNQEVRSKNSLKKTKIDVPSPRSLRGEGFQLDSIQYTSLRGLASLNLRFVTAKIYLCSGTVYRLPYRKPSISLPSMTTCSSPTTAMASTSTRM